MASGRAIILRLRMEIKKNNYFWQEKHLEQLTDAEWESLCDGCARCCLHKLEDEDTEEIFFTRIACRLLDIPSRRCTRYEKRCELVEGCLDLRVGFSQFHWLPSTCAYRLLAEGKSLPQWHPLVCGDTQAMHAAGIGIGSFAIAESPSLDPSDFVVEWLV